MRNLVLAILFSLPASPAWATTYYLATGAGGGSDSNNGTSASTPWLTPNHPVNCGDVILAAASSVYLSSNFIYGNWGTVNCPSGNNVAWLKCAAFDACKISPPSGGAGMDIDKSYWGVQGWEVDGTTATNACFYAYADAGVTIHHIIFANDIANGCGAGGFGASNNGTRIGVDYFNVIGSIVYSSSGNSSGCYSGINIYQPVTSDSLPGTHIYFAGNFAWNNVDGACNGGSPTDGEGLFADTTDASQGGFSPYTQQLVIDNNISIFNGGRGIQTYQNAVGSALGTIYFRHNTAYGNNTQTGQANVGNCGEIEFNTSYDSQAFLNLAQVSAAAAGCDRNAIYAFQVANGNSTDLMHHNLGYCATGTNDGIDDSPGFSYGPGNVFGTNPSFSNPVNPGAPSCGSASSVPNCMATVIANFTPTTATAIPYGYQKPSTTQTYDPLFPQWLCNVNLPPGLVTIGCLAASSLPSSVTITGVTIH